jgi:hypothetical protein
MSCRSPAADHPNLGLESLDLAHRGRNEDGKVVVRCPPLSVFEHKRVRAIGSAINQFDLSGR